MPQSLHAAFADRYGPWALVTGASSGIGASFARALAQRGVNVVVTARRADRLRALADELKNTGVDVRVVAADLAAVGGAAAVVDGVTDLVDGGHLGLVICNAGFDIKGLFADADADVLAEQVELNVKAPLLLSRALVPSLRARGRGGLLIVSSMAAFQGIPWSASYAASKAWSLIFAEGIAEELARDGVDVLALCPGGVRTEAHARSGANPDHAPVAPMEPEDVVAAALRALGKQSVVIPGAANWWGVFLQRFLPRRLNTRAAGRIMKRVVTKTAQTRSLP